MTNSLPADPQHPKPKALFVHRSLGGQFEFFGAWLAKQGWDVTFACASDVAEGIEFSLSAKDQDPNMHLVRFDPRPPSAIPQQDYRHPVDFASQNALAAAELYYRLRNLDGYIPDIVIAHVGWGVGLCVKQVWPECAYIAYHEWFYTHQDWDQGGRSLRPTTLGALVADRMRNLPITAEFDCADANWCPTKFQASRFPPVLRRMIKVISDGVDCETYAPDPKARIDFDWLTLPPEAHILTYATRGMEPIRGFPQFLRALERLQRRRSDFHTVILANESVSYGDQLPEGDSWRLRMIDNLDLNQSRLHVFGLKTRPEYLRLLQASSAHIYFSEPFVTSWSLSEALAAGCLLIGSNTDPVREFVTDQRTGILVDMDDPEEVADMVEWAFDNPKAAARLRLRARERMCKNHNSRDVFARKAAVLHQLLARNLSVATKNKDTSGSL